jgi:DNA-binding response OmpR family regulator
MSNHTEQDSAPHRILLIDDDRKLCRLISDYLSPMGYHVSAIHTGTDGLQAALAETWDAILLDMMLPGIDGFEVLKRIRKESDVPILMLTALSEEPDRIVGLELGADDYLPKTLSPREMLARLRAVTRRSGRRERPSSEPAIRIGKLWICPATHIAQLDDQPLQLTAVEYDLLLALAKAPGRVKTREALLDEIRHRDYEVFDRSIDVHISQLRKKLNDDPKEPRHIRTIRSVGYSLIDPDAP